MGDRVNTAQRDRFDRFFHGHYQAMVAEIAGSDPSGAVRRTRAGFASAYRFWGKVEDGGGVDVGIIRGSMAVGGILGATVIGKSAQRWGPVQLLTFGYVGMGIVSVVFWNAPSVTTQVWVYLVLFGLSGLPGAALGIGMFSAVQKLSPTGMLGRVVGMTGALDALARASGSLLAGLLIGRTKLVVLLDVQSSIYLACGALAFVFLMRGEQGFQRTNEGSCSTLDV